MYVYDQAIDSYILIHSDWTVASLLSLLTKNTRLSHVVVQHSLQPQYFLFRTDLLKFKLGRLDINASILDVLDLDKTEPTITLDAHADVSQAPRMAVIIDQGHIIGVRDQDKYLGPHRGAIVTREFRADFPRQVRMNTVSTLKVVLTPPRTKSLESLSVDVELNQPIEVIVSPDSAFQFAEGETGQKSMVITNIEQEESVSFSFIAHGSGPIGKIRVLLVQNSSLVGEAVVAAEVKTESVSSEIRNHKITVLPQPIAKADLTLTILEVPQPTGSVLLRFIVASDYLGIGADSYTSELPLNAQIDIYFQTLFSDIQTITNYSPEDSDQHLASKGLRLFEIFPKPLQEFLWQQMKHIKSIRIYSQEPWIPWELCKLSGTTNGEYKEDRFFCEAFVITRWLMNMRNKSSLSMKKIGLIVPPDSGLAYAGAEEAFFQNFSNTECQVDNIDAFAHVIMDRLSTGDYDTLHFTGHGQFRDTAPELSVIRLYQNSVLRPENINGRVKNLGKASPIVFLNGCQVGRTAMSLTGIGGWAHSFITAGAGAFIGALWNIDDKTAFKFAEAFYTALRSGETVGEATRTARLAVKKRGDSTWLAYTVFADPQARLQS